MDHDAVRVVGGQGFGQRARVVVDEAAGEVVLHDEGARGAGGPHDLCAAPGREGRAGRVLEQRLADEDPCPGGPEGGFEQVGAYPVGVHRHGDGAQPGGAGGGQQASVRRRLDQDGGAGRGEGAQGDGQGALATGGDQDVVPGVGGSDLAGEPGPQFTQPVHGRPAPGARPAARPRQGCGERPFGLESGVQIAAVELDDPGGRCDEGGEEAGGVDGAGDGFGAAVAAQGDLLPGGVPGFGYAGAGLGPERAGAGAGDDEPFGGELRDRPGDGDRTDPETFDEGPAGRELSTG